MPGAEMLEVNRWTGFTRYFVHLKTGEPAKDPTLLLTAILADATNMGLAKMAESCPGTSLAITPGTPTNGLLKADFDPSVLLKRSLVLLNVRNIPFLEVTRTLHDFQTG
jgi:Tn3 transposase DDE domain